MAITVHQSLAGGSTSGDERPPRVGSTDGSTRSRVSPVRWRISAERVDLGLRRRGRKRAGPCIGRNRSVRPSRRFRKVGEGAGSGKPHADRRRADREHRGNGGAQSDRAPRNPNMPIGWIKPISAGAEARSSQCRPQRRLRATRRGTGVQPLALARAASREGPVALVELPDDPVDARNRGFTFA